MSFINPLHRDICRDEEYRMNRQLLKIEVLTHYGDGKCVCVKCGFDDLRALSIDHINGDGNKERRNLKKSGSSFYSYLRLKNYPEGYQTLCMNCQFIKKAKKKECSKGQTPKMLPPLNWFHTPEEYASIISDKD